MFLLEEQSCRLLRKAAPAQEGGARRRRTWACCPVEFTSPEQIKLHIPPTPVLQILDVIFLGKRWKTSQFTRSIALFEDSLFLVRPSQLLVMTSPRLGSSSPDVWEGTGKQCYFWPHCWSWTLWNPQHKRLSLHGDFVTAALSYACLVASPI